MITTRDTRLYFLHENEVVETTADVSIEPAYHDKRFVWPKLKRKKFSGRLKFKPIDGPGIRILRAAIASLHRKATLRMHLRLKRHGKNWRHLKLPRVPNV